MRLKWKMKIYQLFMWMLALSLIFLASQILPTILKKREEYQFTQNHPLENAPPQLVIATTALGGLRGFMIDYLWLRVTELRNKGLHYEVVQLYDWISKLEPRIPDVWSYISWEMAYNIAETVTTPDDKWRWLYKGIQQLRDYGIIYNQNTAKLYWELGFLIHNKVELNDIQQYSHHFYLRWFQLMNEILGTEFDPSIIASAPENYEELVKDSARFELLKTIREQAKIDILKDFYLLTTLPEETQEKLLEIFAQEKHKTPAEQIIAYIIRQRIQNELKMSPQKMLQINQKYGKLDWRLASSHTLYWAEEGIQALARFRANPSRKLKELSMESLEQNLDRLQHLGLQRSFEYGTFLALAPQRVICIPNFAVLDSLQELCENIQKKWGLEQGRESHETFLRRAIIKCYLYNRREQARKYFTILQKKFPRNSDYQQDMDSFIIFDIGRSINFGQPHIVENYIIANQLDAYLALLEGNLEKFNGLNHVITMVYNRYVERHEQTENIYIKPRSLEYFQRSAVQIIHNDRMARYGKDGVEKFWKEVIARFPIFEKLRPHEEKK